MSESLMYGRLWEEVRIVRAKLATKLGISPTDLADAIRIAADQTRQVSMLLALWAELEAKMAKLEED